MTINVAMSKEEFIDYLNYQEFKTQVNCGIIDLEGKFNELLKMLLEDECWKDNNKYDKQLKKINECLLSIKRGAGK